jgi:diaminopimelate decarboxylase
MANISVGHIDSKFGISVHPLPHLVQLLKIKMNIVGIHMHTGSIWILKYFLYAAEILFAARNKT